MSHKYYTRNKKKSLDNNENHTCHQIFEGGDFYENLKNILEEANVGDLVSYQTNNQLGVRLYEIVINEKNQRTIKEIGDIHGRYDDPEHPEHPGCDNHF